MNRNIMKLKQTKINLNKKLVDGTHNMYNKVTSKADVINPLLEVLKHKLSLYNNEYPKNSYQSVETI
ncbi:MAG: hypothetical protein RBR07_05615 [Arcobacteraceae bacterium]|nr:hypothetical protein [Arcobacteraceae bacterium]